MAVNNDTASTAATPRWFYPDGELVRSLNARYGVVVVLTNQTPGPVEVFWVSYKGLEVSYGILQPGAKFECATFLTHPWLAKSLLPNGAERQLLIQGQKVWWPKTSDGQSEGGAAVAITEAETAIWSPSAHNQHFQEELQFRTEVAEVLRAYHHLKGRARSGCLKAPAFKGLAETGLLPWAEWLELACANWTTGTMHNDITPVAGNKHCRIETDALEHGALQPNLGSLPFDLILEVIAFLAPRPFVYKRFDKHSVQLFPLEQPVFAMVGDAGANAMAAAAGVMAVGPVGGGVVDAAPAPAGADEHQAAPAGGSQQYEQQHQQAPLQAAARRAAEAAFREAWHRATAIGPNLPLAPEHQPRLPVNDDDTEYGCCCSAFVIQLFQWGMAQGLTSFT